MGDDLNVPPETSNAPRAIVFFLQQREIKCYRILAVIDKIVLHHPLPVDESVASPPARRRRAARGDAVPRGAPTTKVDKFIDDFVKFRASLN